MPVLVYLTTAQQAVLAVRLSEQYGLTLEQALEVIETVLTFGRQDV